MYKLDNMLHSPSVNEFVCRRIRYLVKALYGRSNRDQAYLEHVVQMLNCVMSDSQAAIRAIRIPWSTVKIMQWRRGTIGVVLNSGPGML